MLNINTTKIIFSLAIQNGHLVSASDTLNKSSTLPWRHSKKMTSEKENFQKERLIVEKSWEIHNSMFQNQNFTS